MGSSSEAEWGASSSSGSSSSSGGSSATVRVKVPAGTGSSLRRLLNQSKETLIAEEKGLLRQVVELLEEVSPQVGGGYKCVGICVWEGGGLSHWSQSGRRPQLCGHVCVGGGKGGLIGRN
jgi:hypothetical protein